MSMIKCKVCGEIKDSDIVEFEKDICKECKLKLAHQMKVMKKICDKVEKEKESK